MASSLILYGLIRLFSYQELHNQYPQGGIEAVFGITESNYHFGLILSLVFAIAAVFKGLELKHTESKTNKIRQLLAGILVVVVGIFAVYFTFVNLLILINPGYF